MPKFFLLFIYRLIASGSICHNLVTGLSWGTRYY
jgi:hypothetical protein